MTSSKSFRASLLPSSLSVLRTNSDPASSASSSTTGSRKKKLHKSKTADLAHMRSAEEEPASSHNHDAVRPNNSDADNTANGHENGELVPPHAASRKSKTWGNRLSSFLPSLISPHTDPVSSPPIMRKPVESTTAQSSPTSTLNDGTSTPSLRITEPPTSATTDSENSLGIVSPTIPPPTQDPPPIPVQVDFGETEIPQISMSVSSPHIVSIPPSPEMKRSSLERQEPAVLPPAQHSPPESTSGDSQKSGKLQKPNPDSRRRSGSLQQLKQDLSLKNLKTRQTSPMTEARGRRSVSAQPSSPRKGGSGTRVTSTPMHARQVSTQGEANQSPTRGRLRRSWLPGGGRSRSNSVDVSHVSSVGAWVISDDTHAEYNASFLQNAEKVSQLESDVWKFTKRY